MSAWRDLIYINSMPQFFNKIIKVDPENKFGKYSYLSRNKIMIDHSDICVFYLDPSQDNTKSGTMVAHKYARHKNKKIINIYENHTQ